LGRKILNIKGEKMNLRPFDPEAAKVGKKICFANGDETTYISGPDKINCVAVRGADDLLMVTTADCLRQKPLGYCEGKPVYPGDVLYNKIAKHGVTMVPEDTAHFEGWTWTPPKKPLCVIDGKELFGGETVWHKASGSKYIMQDVPHMLGYPAQFTLTPPKKKTVLSLWKHALGEVKGYINPTPGITESQYWTKLHAIGVTEDGDVEVCDE